MRRDQILAATAGGQDNAYRSDGDRGVRARDGDCLDDAGGGYFCRRPSWLDKRTARGQPAEAQESIGNADREKAGCICDRHSACYNILSVQRRDDPEWNRNRSRSLSGNNGIELRSRQPDRVDSFNQFGRTGSVDTLDGRYGKCV